MISFKILEEKFLAYLVCSVVPFLAFSIFFADLICSILSIFFIIYLIKHNSIFFYKNIIFIAALFFYFLCLFSSFLSEEILFSLKSSLPLIRIIIFIFLVSFLIENNKFFLDVFYNFLKYTFLTLVIYGLVLYFYEYYISLSNNTIAYVRLKLPFSDEEKLGSLLVRLYGLLIAIYILKKNYNKFENFLLFFLTLFTSVVILLSGERNSLFFLMLLTSTWFISLNIGFKIKISFFLVLFTSFALILTQNSNLSERMILDKNNDLKFSSDQKELIIFTRAHTAHYVSGFKMFKDKPFTGQGPRMFRLLCDKEDYKTIINNKKSCSSHPHNTYIQLLAEIGVFGTILFSLIFFHIIFIHVNHVVSKIFFKKNTLTNYQVIISTSALIVVWPFSPSGNFFNNWMLIICALPLSFYFNEFFRYNFYNKK